MVREAQAFEEQDKKNYERIEAKNALENYAFSMRNMVSDSAAVLGATSLLTAFRDRSASKRQ